MEVLVLQLTNKGILNFGGVMGISCGGGTKTSSLGQKSPLGFKLRNK